MATEAMERLRSEMLTLSATERAELAHERSVAVLVIHFGTPSRQNDCARRQPVVPGFAPLRGSASARCAYAKPLRRMA